MPRWPRNGNKSCSRICVTSLPSTVMRPESGGNNPSASFRIVLLPAPATPNRALVSPNGSWNETPRRTSLSPNARCTSSNTIAEPDGRSVTAAPQSVGKVGADIGLPVVLFERQHGNQQLGDKEISDQDQHGRGHYRLRRRPAHALRSATRGHAVIAADGRNDETEQNRLEQPHDNILKHQRFPGIGPVLAGIETEEQLGHHQAAGQPNQIG